MHTRPGGTQPVQFHLGGIAIVNRQCRFDHVLAVLTREQDFKMGAGPLPNPAAEEYGTITT